VNTDKALKETLEYASGAGKIFNTKRRPAKSLGGHLLDLSKKQ